MKHMSFRCGLAVALFGVFGVTSPAAANPEIIIVYGEHAGMAGAGMSTAEGAGASVYNPAGLGTVESYAVSADFTLGFSDRLFEPALPGAPDAEGGGLAPYFNAGFAYRLLPELVMGVSAYTRAGAGATYEDQAIFQLSEFSASQGFIEVAVPVAYQVGENFTVAASLRFVYAGQSLLMKAGNVTVQDSSVSGFRWIPSLSLGVEAEPVSGLRVGASYDMKTVVEVDGTVEGVDTTTGMPFSADLEGKLRLPHNVRAGVDYQVTDSFAVLADVAYHLYSDTVAEGEAEQNDTFEAHLGLEYAVADGITLRTGYGFSQSATTDESSNPFAVPAGTIHAVTAGASAAFSDFVVDLSGGYGFVVADEVPMAGTYNLTVPLVGIGLTYAPGT